MPYNGSGVWTASGADFPAVASTLIESTKYNNVVNDVATGLSTALLKDGTQTVTANIPMGGYKITGLGVGAARLDAASMGSIQDGTGSYVFTVGGTANAITLTAAPVITAYVAGMTFRFIATFVNTAAVTVAVSGLAAKAITKGGATALLPGDIPLNAIVTITYDGTQFQLTAVTATYGTFTATATGMTGSVTSPAHYMVSNGFVFVSLDTILSGTSNTTGFSFTGLPAGIQTTADRYTSLLFCLDNGILVAAHGKVASASGTFLLTVLPSGLWTGSGTKALYSTNFFYSLA